MKTVKIQIDQAFYNTMAPSDWFEIANGMVIGLYNSRAKARDCKSEGSKIVKVSTVLQQLEVVAPVVKTPASVAAPKTPKIPLIRESTIERPCKQVWHIADAMLAEVGGDVSKMSRKAVLAKCVASGIAFYTARTQYQMWLTIQNGGTLK